MEGPACRWLLQGECLKPPPTPPFFAKHSPPFLSWPARLPRRRAQAFTVTPKPKPLPDMRNHRHFSEHVRIERLLAAFIQERRFHHTKWLNKRRLEHEEPLQGGASASTGGNLAWLWLPLGLQLELEKLCNSNCRCPHHGKHTELVLMLLNRNFCQMDDRKRHANPKP